MRWTLPNILTVARLVAAPSLVAVYVIFPRPISDWLALGLFVVASLTDYFDGVLARRWQQVSAFGKMLDPIADKAMTVIALLLLVYLMNGLTFALGRVNFDEATLVLIPAALIMFREIFVSGLREFLGARSSGLAVTRLAKWKTAVQMLAISVLFAQGLFEHYFGILAFGFTKEMTRAILSGAEQDLFGLTWKYHGFFAAQYSGIALLWLAALLTLWTGFDYFRKALPFLQEENMDD